MPTILLRVDGMRSSDDETRVETALRAEPGVLAAVASRQDKCAEVECEDDEVTVERLVEVIETVGFSAVLAG